MEKFEFLDNHKYKKITIREIDSEFSTLQNEKNYQNTNKENVNVQINHHSNKEKKLFNNIPTLKPEEISKFIYDLTKENLTSSTFRYAFRNFGNNVKEKCEYLKVLLVFIIILI
jgi:hypothetical protein